MDRMSNFRFGTLVDEADSANQPPALGPLTKVPQSSFDKLPDLFINIQQRISTNVSFILVGNQCDRPHSREVEKHEAQLFAASYGIDYKETSAKDGTNVEALFVGLTEFMHESKSGSAKSFIKPSVTSDIKESSGDYDFLAKVLLLGDSGVGKSCLVERFAEDKFTPVHTATIGIDFKIKIVSVDDKRVKMQLWDCSGQKRYHSIVNAYLRSVAGLVIVFDLTQRETFLEVEKWFTDFGEKNADIAKILIGNKSDLIHSRTISQEEACALAQSQGARYMESSAKDGMNVDQIFIDLAQIMYNSQLFSVPSPVQVSAFATVKPTKKKPSMEETKARKLRQEKEMEQKPQKLLATVLPQRREKSFEEVVVKLLLLGDSGVGKSCLITKFADDKFVQEHNPTIGIDFKKKEIDLDKKKVNVQMFDTAGLERFQSITISYLKSARGFLVVFDVTKRETYGNLTKWFKMFEDHDLKSEARVLVGNKSDLSGDRMVSKEEAQSLAEKYGVPYVETSCKETEAVEDLFHDLVKIILKSTIHPIPSVPKVETGEEKKLAVKSEPNTHKPIIPDQRTTVLKPVVKKEEYNPERAQEYKVLLIGDTAVGKSSLLLKFKDGTLEQYDGKTTGVDFAEIPVNVDDKWMKLHVWDAAGREQYHSLISSFYSIAQGIMVVFDITKKETFLGVWRWFDEIKKNSPNNIPIILVGNKADWRHSRSVTEEDCQKLAEEFSVPYMECSADTGENVREVFVLMGRRARDMSRKLGIPQTTPTKTPRKTKAKGATQTDKKTPGSKACILL